MPHHDGEPHYVHGRVCVLTAEGDQAGALVAVACASQAFARSGAFEDYVGKLCRHVLDRNPEDLQCLARQDWSYEGGTVMQALRRFAEQEGQGLRVRRLARFANPEGLVWGWVHPDRSRGMLLSLTTRCAAQPAREVAFQLGAQILLERSGAIVMGEQGPEEVFDTFDLSMQPWSREPNLSVQQVLDARLGEGSRLEAYARFEVGGLAS